MSESSLEPLRKSIDRIDRFILDLLVRRLKVVKKIGLLKKTTKAPIYDPIRKKSLLSAIQHEAETVGLSPSFIHDVFTLILEESCRIQEAIPFDRKT